MTTPTRNDHLTPKRSVAGEGLAPGAVAGLAGGVVFGAAMAVLGTLPSVASIVRAESPVVGFVVHMAIAAFVGAVFGALVWRQNTRGGELLFWGLAYGALWWFLGALTLRPLILGAPVSWELAQAQAALPSLLGHFAYGASTAVAFALLRRTGKKDTERIRAGTVLRGAVAGVGAAGVLVLVVDVMAGMPLTWMLAVGVVGGAAYPVLFGDRREGAGPAVVRGVAYGLIWWLVAGVTLGPLVRDGRLAWALGDLRGDVATLPAHLLLGAGTAALFTGLGALSRLVFADDVRRLREESGAAWGGRATGYGALAGLVGGLVFTVVMATGGVLPRVARLVGAESAATGLIVHLLIAQVIGVSYALAFRRRSYDAGSAIGWGLSYGFLWWILGALTLFPLLLGGAPRWDAVALAAMFPSLVGHLAYGAALGLVYYALESRVSPWWLTRGQVEAERVAARREQVLGSAPALWTLTTLLALTIPLLIK